MQFTNKLGDVTVFEVMPNTFHFLPHIVNTQAKMNSGVALGIKQRFPAANEEYVKWKNNQHPKGFPKCLGDYNKDWQLGNLQVVGVGGSRWICNMLAQKDFGNFGMPAGRYEALEECLRKLRVCCLQVIEQDKKVQIEAPKFGSLRSGLDWTKIFTMVRNIFTDVEGIWTTYTYQENGEIPSYYENYRSNSPIW